MNQAIWDELNSHEKCFPRITWHRSLWVLGEVSPCAFSVVKWTWKLTLLQTSKICSLETNFIIADHKMATFYIIFPPNCRYIVNREMALSSDKCPQLLYRACCFHQQKLKLSFPYFHSPWDQRAMYSSHPKGEIV